METRNGFADYLRSIYIWGATAVMVVLYCFIIFFVWLFERRDPLHRKTDDWIRRLNKQVVRVNPFVTLDISGLDNIDPTRNYIVVANHQSLVDIPMVSHLPMHMKWVAKKSLFSVPVLGWIMKMSGGISVDLSVENKRNQILQQANIYLHQNYTVIFFPEGIRSTDGSLGRFSKGAFDLAVDTRTTILPVVMDDLWDFLPMRSWVFAKSRAVKIRVLKPVETAGMDAGKDAGYLRERVRFAMLEQLAEWRSVSKDEVDGIYRDSAKNRSEEISSCPLYL
jgi:1-acyl-sn-glycerol-3-phosphate acyltransferase